MKELRVIIISLRRPRSDNDSRNDPFWEFGSFGCTGCHQNNIMNPQKAYELEGARLAFAQGGDKGCRLLYVTPPIKVLRHGALVEVRWTPPEMPFRYNKAPILAKNPDTSDFPLLKNFISDTNRSSIESKFSSRFRSRREPIPLAIAIEIVTLYEKLYQPNRSNPLFISSSYIDALPSPPSVINHHRRETYKRLLGTNMRNRGRC